MSPTLCFDRAGDHLLVVEPGVIDVRNLRSLRSLRLPYAGARAVAGFNSQIWIATRHDQLVRVDLAGRPLGDPAALPFSGKGGLVPAPLGPAGAVWTAAPPVALLDVAGTLACTTLAGADVVLPLVGRRCVSARGPKLTLPSGITTRLPPKTTVLGGAVMANGKGVTLLVTSGSDRELIVMSVSTGRVVRRYVVPDTAVRLAAKRFIAVTQTDPCTLRVIDLRSGRDIGVIARDHEIRDHAIDPTGRRLAIRSNHGAVELHDLSELLRPVKGDAIQRAIDAIEPQEPPALVRRGSSAAPRRASRTSSASLTSYRSAEPAPAAGGR